MKKPAIICLILVLMVLTGSTVLSQELGQKVYWMSITEIPLGKLTAYHKFNAEKLAPLMEKHGYKPIATWQTIVGDIEEVISVSEFENMEAYHKARRSLLGSEEYKIISKEFADLAREIRTKFLSGAPYSKLK